MIARLQTCFLCVLLAACTPSAASTRTAPTTPAVAPSVAATGPSTPLPHSQQPVPDAELRTPVPRPTLSRTPAPLYTLTPTPTALNLPTLYSTAPVGWETYLNAEYGFTFRIPPGWLLEEHEPVVLAERWQMGPSLTLEKDQNRLIVGFKHGSEVDIMVGCTGTAAGDMIEGGSIQFFEQEVPIIRLVYKNRLKTLYFGLPCGEIVVERLVFFIALYGDESDFDALDLDLSIIDEVIQILATFEFVQTSS